MVLFGVSFDYDIDHILVKCSSNVSPGQGNLLSGSKTLEKCILVVAICFAMGGTNSISRASADVSS